MAFTTMEKLRMQVSATYGAVIKFGDRVFVTDSHRNGGFTAAIYEFIETPEETGLEDIECRVHLIQTATERFVDNGHALAWCMAQK